VTCPDTYNQRRCNVGYEYEFDVRPDDFIIYTNYYHCPICDHNWEEWDCMCNDRCPECNREIEPYTSKEI